jgi:hypothetical protein
MTTITKQVETVKTVNEIIVTSVELGEILSSETRSTIVNVTYLVDESKSKQVKGKKQVQKRVNITHLYLNQPYGKKVNNILRDKQGVDVDAEPFVPQELNGKTRINTVLVRSDKNQNILLDGKVLFGESRHNLGYFHKGNRIEVDKNDISLNSNLFTPKFFEQKSGTSGRGLIDTENDFCMMTLGLNNIEKIKFKGNWYKVKN